jgi:hypothetical protein
MLCSSTINYRCRTKPNNLSRHTSDPTLRITQPRAISEKCYPGLESNAPYHINRVTSETLIGFLVTMWPLRFSSFFRPWAPIPLVRVRNGIRLDSLYPRAGTPWAQVYWSPQYIQGFRPNSTQKTSLIGEDYPRFICCAPPPSITDVGLNLTIKSSEQWVLHYSLKMTLPKFKTFTELYLSSSAWFAVFILFLRSLLKMLHFYVIPLKHIFTIGWGVERRKFRHGVCGGSVTVRPWLYLNQSS